MSRKSSKIGSCGGITLRVSSPAMVGSVEPSSNASSTRTRKRNARHSIAVLENNGLSRVFPPARGPL